MRLHNSDVVRHFKREQNSEGNAYLYRIINMDVLHTETAERCVVYEALYSPFQVYVRPYDAFMSEVDHEKYPNIKQKWRFEKEV